MKLEAKHLAPYLPYGLQVEYKGKATMLDALENEGGAYVGDDKTISFVSLKYIKPSLRPLSSMTKKEAYELGALLMSEADMEDKKIGIGSMNIMGDRYPTIMYQDQEDEEYSVMVQFNSTGMLVSGINLIPYIAYEWLFKNHFDVFGLIDKGLAIEK